LISTVVEALVALQQAIDQLIGMQLHPLQPELLQSLHRHGYSPRVPFVRALVRRISSALIDRLLGPVL
jgi:hypothetical protein